MKFQPLSTVLLACLALTQASVKAQLESSSDPAGFLLRRMAPHYEEEAGKLRNMPPQQYDFSKSPLGDVIRFVANDAKISYISLPDDSPEASKIITFSINASPFQVLETVCQANGLAIIPENGLWYFRPADDRELIGRGYAVRYNAMERVTKSTGSSLGTAASNGTSVDLQGGKETFTVARSELINDIRSILDLQPEEVEMAAAGQGGGAAAAIPGLGSASQMAAMNNSSELSAYHKPKVLWKSDSNMLYVVATRLQHMWVEGYLLAADKEQSLIGIEVKFIETSSDPTSELGLDWNNTLGDTGTFRQSEGFDDDGKLIYKMQPNTAGGFRTDLSELLSAHNLNSYVDFHKANQLALSGSSWPLAVLSNQDLSVTLRALLRTQDTKQVSYPRMVTLNNREVAISSVINQPVLGTGSTSQASGTSIVSQSITYLPIGTVLNILPKRMDGDKILLNVAVTISTILGEQVIAGNKYPIATSRVYNAPVEVNDGYTVAIGGLDEAKQKQGSTGVPLLGRIPIIGYLFKSKTHSQNNKSLMLFITPTLLDPKQGGLAKGPQTVVPAKPAHLLPQKPKVDANGLLAGGTTALPGAVEYMTRELDKVATTIDEGIATEEDSQKLTDMRIALNHLISNCENILLQQPGEPTAARAKADLEQLNSRVGGLKRTVIKNGFY